MIKILKHTVALLNEPVLIKGPVAVVNMKKILDSPKTRRSSVKKCLKPITLKPGE